MFNVRELLLQIHKMHHQSLKFILLIFKPIFLAELPECPLLVAFHCCFFHTRRRPAGKGVCNITVEQRLILLLKQSRMGKYIRADDLATGDGGHAMPGAGKGSHH